MEKRGGIDVRRAAIVIGGIFAFTFLLTVPALAQTYPPQTPTVETGTATTSPGGQMLLTGDNWLAGSTVTLDLHTQAISLGQAPVGANGSFSKLVTIPSSVSPGAHTVEARGTGAGGNPAVARTSLTVVSAGTSGGGTSLTGANISFALLLMLGLMIGGSVALFTARRRTIAPRRVKAE